MRDNFLNTPNPTEGKVSTLKDVQNVGVRNTCVPFKQGTGLFYTCTQSDFPSDESGLLLGTGLFYPTQWTTHTLTAPTGI